MKYYHDWFCKLRTANYTKMCTYRGTPVAIKTIQIRKKRQRNLFSFCFQIMDMPYLKNGDANKIKGYLLK